MKKIIIAFLVILLIFFLTIGYFFYDNVWDKDELNEYSINYVESNYVINENGYTLEGNSTIILQNITTQNITRIFFNLMWHDSESWTRDGNDPDSSFPEQNTRIYTPSERLPDTFSLSIKEPNSSKVSSYDPDNTVVGTSFHGRLEINATLNKLPDNKTVNAKSSKDILYPTTVLNGVGIWEINITCIDAPGHGTGGFVPGPQDMGNEWVLLITIHSYDANISKIN